MDVNNAQVGVEMWSGDDAKQCQCSDINRGIRYRLCQ